MVLPLNILIACPTRSKFNIDDRIEGSLGGIESTSIHLALSLSARGHKVTLATQTEMCVVRDNVINVPLQAIGDSGRSVFDAAITSNDLRCLDPLGDTVKILWLRNPISIEKSIRRGQLSRYIRYRPDVVFLSKNLEGKTSNLFPFRSRHVIPHGISDIFHKADLTTKRGPIFVWASQPQRGLSTTLKAWITYIHPRVPDAQFHIFGFNDADKNYNIEEMSKKGVYFFGRVDRSALINAYQSAVAMLYPGAHDETFCSAAAEANLLGLPVITLGYGCLGERIQHGINGFVARDIEQMSEFAITLLANSSLRELMQKGSIAIARSYNWELAAIRWEILISSLKNPSSRSKRIFAADAVSPR